MIENPLERLIKRVIGNADDPWLFYDKEVGESQRIDFVDLIMYGLKDLHPAELASLFCLIQAARELRYLGPHPDPREALEACLARQPKPQATHGKGRLAHGNASALIDQHKQVLRGQG